MPALEIYTDDDLVVPLSITDVAGVAINTTGWIYTAKLHRYEQSPTAMTEYERNNAAGLVKFKVDNSIIATLPTGPQYKVKIQRTDASDDTETIYVRDVIIKPIF